MTEDPESSTPSRFYPSYDANGNVSEYVDDTDSVVAHYEYSPFGKITFSDGSKAGDFNHRFSTKYLDDETFLYYYGYRYYSNELGRWLNRDPKEESGGLNLYAFIENNAITSYDLLGLRADWLLDWRDATKDTPVLGGLNDMFYGGAWAAVNPVKTFSAMKEQPNLKHAYGGLLAAQNAVTFGAGDKWLELTGTDPYADPDVRRGREAAEGPVNSTLIGTGLPFGVTKAGTLANKLPGLSKSAWNATRSGARQAGRMTRKSYIGGKKAYRSTVSGAEPWSHALQQSGRTTMEILRETYNMGGVPLVEGRLLKFAEASMLGYLGYEYGPQAWDFWSNVFKPSQSKKQWEGQRSTNQGPCE